MNYSEKLKDPRWQKKRLEILQRDNWMCFVCQNDKSTLHVHHQKYNGCDPWTVDGEFLTTLCEDCHDKEHAYGGYIERRKNILKLSLLNDNDLRIFIRKRLGQKYPVSDFEVGTEWYGGRGKPIHKRFDFNAHNIIRSRENHEILYLFKDLFRSKCILSWKGSLWVTHEHWNNGYCPIYPSDDFLCEHSIDYSGYGTVDIIQDLIKRSIEIKFPFNSYYL
jgi:hypothetical protein